MIRACNATLEVGDDFGDNPCTFQCDRLYSHKGMHKVEFQGNRGRRIVRWDGDDRPVHERPEGGLLYYDFDCSPDILESLLDCLPYEDPARESLFNRMLELYEDDVELTISLDETIKNGESYKILLADLIEHVQKVLGDRYNLVEIVKPTVPKSHSEFWLKPVR